ncbi:MAG: transporter permease [Proteobacteria bacterium]|nr:transporter permease [Pseudomonadota bacterium]
MTVSALRRLAGMLLTTWLLASAVFLLLQAAPGDPLAALGGDFQSTETRAHLAQELGLNRSLGQRYVDWLNGLAQADLGRSYAYQRPVLEVILERLPVTFAIVLPALLGAALLGVALGFFAARAPHSGVSRLTAALCLLLFAIPVYWLAHLLVQGFSLHLGWLPAQGLRDLRAMHSGAAAWLDLALHLLLPICAAGLHQLAALFLIARTRIADEMRAPHFATAIAKGLSLGHAQWRHALPQAALSLVTLLGMRFAALLTSATLVEIAFGLPGIGRLFVDAARGRDYPLVLGVFLCVLLLTLLANTLSDLLCRQLDPRLRGAQR